MARALVSIGWPLHLSTIVAAVRAGEQVTLTVNRDPVAAELELGVLRAQDTETCALRLATLSRVRSAYSLIPIDSKIASCFTRIAAQELEAGRKLRRHDAWIAATALRYGTVVVTQDDDFSAFSSVSVVHV
jgi:predicted nucleic acid-binding protein